MLQEGRLKEQINLTLKEETQLPLGCVLSVSRLANDYRFWWCAPRACRTLIYIFFSKECNLGRNAPSEKVLCVCGIGPPEFFYIIYSSASLWPRPFTVREIGHSRMFLRRRYPTAPFMFVFIIPKSAYCALGAHKKHPCQTTRLKVFAWFNFSKILVSVGSTKCFSCYILVGLNFHHLSLNRFQNIGNFSCQSCVLTLFKTK